MSAGSTNVRSVLVVLLGSIGDVARGLVVVSAIKRSFPGCRITWVVEPLCQPLVALHKGIDRVLLFDRKRPISGLMRLRNDLRQERYDVALDMQRIFKSGIFAWLSGAPRRIGFHRRDAKEFNWIFQTETIPELGENIPKLQHYLTFSSQLGADNAEIDFGLDPGPASEKVKALLDQISKPFVAVLLGSSWESKNWPLSGYEGLLARLEADRAYSVLLCGDKSQVVTAAALRAVYPNVRSCVGETSLVELLQILKQARLLVGPDSGPAHMACAVGVSCITLFGPTNPGRVAPWGSEELSLRSSIGCAGCYKRRCPGLGGLCMRLLSPDAVYHLAQRALQSQP
ncbi:MAG: glycosyltransferase family 9 protein [Oligoflexia bacterium]|nr:glycosyltransferase family 9 protein [Oligoflexia bacterium]